MKNRTTVWGYIENKMKSLKEEGRKVTAENYGKAMRCLRRYYKEEDLTFEDITEEFIGGFNSYLKRTNIQKSTVSFYNRVLRSIYNQAVYDGILKNSHPFDNVYTKVERKFVTVSSSVKTASGEIITFDQMSQTELVNSYRNLLDRYNSLVNQLSAMVGGR